jgi:hypothetical protein
VDNHQIKLQGPRLHAMPWRHMLIAGSSLLIIYGLKFLQLI